MKLFLSIAGLILAFPVWAQAAEVYPTRPVRMIVGFPPGGGVDTVARLISPKLTERWGQQVVVDNRPGAGTIIGTTLAAKAQADGYTILLASSSYGINPGLHKKLPYDPLKDLVPVSQTVVQPYVLAVSATVPARTVGDLLSLARAKPGSLNFGSPGNGSGGHLAAEYFQMLAHVKFVHVPYRGTAPALVDLIGGRIQMMFATILPTLPHIKSGKLRALAVSTPKRAVSLPDVPTVAESGVPDYEASSWTGIMVPAGVSQEIISKIHKDVVWALDAPDVQKNILKSGAEPVGSSPQEFSRMVRDEIQKWAKVIKAANVQPN